MKKVISGLLIASLLIFVGLESGFAKKAPVVSGKDVSGKGRVTSTKYIGKKVVLINFWATWCPPCRGEIPDLVKLQKKYKSKFLIIGVSFDEDAKTVVSYIGENGVNYPVIMVDSKLEQAYGGIEAIPTTFIIDLKGEIVEGPIVGSRSYEEFEKLIKKYIK